MLIPASFMVMTLLLSRILDSPAVFFSLELAKPVLSAHGEKWRGKGKKERNLKERERERVRLRVKIKHTCTTFYIVEEYCVRNLQMDSPSSTISAPLR